MKNRNLEKISNSARLPDYFDLRKIIYILLEKEYDNEDLIHINKILLRSKVFMPEYEKKYSLYENRIRKYPIVLNVIENYLFHLKFLVHKIFRN
jgi:hypothetical protein